MLLSTQDSAGGSGPVTSRKTKAAKTKAAKKKDGANEGAESADTANRKAASVQVENKTVVILKQAIGQRTVSFIYNA